MQRHAYEPSASDRDLFLHFFFAIRKFSLKRFTSGTDDRLMMLRVDPSVSEKLTSSVRSNSAPWSCERGQMAAYAERSS